MLQRSAQLRINFKASLKNIPGISVAVDEWSDRTLFSLDGNDSYDSGS